MDMTKAFDRIKFSVLFSKLWSAGLPSVFLRLVMFIYMEQFANVRWENSFSNIFSFRNGVRQGAVASAISTASMVIIYSICSEGVVMAAG